jgi:hypothetical protein
VQCDVLTKLRIPPHFIELDCNCEFNFYVDWCNIFTVITFHSFMLPLIKYLLTFFSYHKYYIFHIEKLQSRMHCGSTIYIYMTVYKKDKVCMFGYVCFLLKYFLFIVLRDFHCHAVITFYRWELIEYGRLCHMHQYLLMFLKMIASEPMSNVHQYLLLFIS